MTNAPTLPPAFPRAGQAAPAKAVSAKAADTEADSTAQTDISLDVGFDDLLDAINPLQHLPVISAVYREATGDQIGIGARLGGDFLYGGVVGLACGAAQAAFEWATGDTPLGHLQALLGTSSDSVPTQVASVTSEKVSASPVRRLGSSAALTEALRRARPTETSSVAIDPRTQPAPELLAKYYELHALRRDSTSA